MESLPVGLPPSIAAWADRIVEELSRDYNFGYSAVLLFDRGAHALRLVGQRSATDDEPGKAGLCPALIPLDSIAGSVFRSGSPTLLSDVRSHPDHRSTRGAARGSELVVPILFHGRPIGVINVESPRIGGLDISDLEHLEATALRGTETIPTEALSLSA